MVWYGTGHKDERKDMAENKKIKDYEKKAEGGDFLLCSE
jgi:hypothetical protein